MSDDGAGRGEGVYRRVEDVYRHVQAARDALTVRRVFGEAYEADGATVIPVARVVGGSATGAGRGDGSGSLRADGSETRMDDPDARSDVASGDAAGEGAGYQTADGAASEGAGADGPRRVAGVSGGVGGFAVCARPAGVFVIRDGEVMWKPAWNLNAAILGGQVLGSAVALATAGVLRAYAKRRRHF